MKKPRSVGGGAEHVPIDSIEALAGVVNGYGDVSPELAFDRQWAVDMVSRVAARLRAEYLKRGRENWFDALEPALPGGSRLPPYATLIGQLNTTESALKKAVFDLRAAFAARLKEEIRATVSTNEDAEEELRYLVSVLIT